MANLKSITDLPVAESVDGLNLIVNDNGSAKQIPASKVGAQADWAETNENSPAFVKNKPEVVQADWNELDEASPSYVKNKPFWAGETVEMVIIDEFTHNFSSSGFYGQLNIDPVEIIENQNYIVTFDGVQYNCVAFLHDYGNHASIGDANSMNGYDDGIPFFITIYDNKTVIFVSESGEHTISVIKQSTDIHKIDEKYLPKCITANIVVRYDEESGEDVTREYAKPFVLYDSHYGDNSYDLSRYIEIDDDGRLVLPTQITFCNMSRYGKYIDISNASAGETISLTVSPGDGDYWGMTKACWNGNSIIRGTIADTGVYTDFIMMSNSSTTVLTSNNKVCQVINQGHGDPYNGDYYVELTVTVLGTLTLS